MHDHHIPMRWADLDQLGHVNNVVYVEYALEARDRMVEDGALEANLPVRHVRVDFRRSLLLSDRPVLVRSSVDGPTLTQQICSPDGSTVFCTVEVQHGPATGVQDDRGVSLQIQLRRGDLAPDGTVATGHLFTVFQEARIALFSRLLPRLSAGRFVIGRVELDLGDPLPWRSDPYPVTGHVAHVGRSSFSSVTRIEGGRHGSATATLVGFDLATQASRPLDDDEREALLAGMLPDGD